MAKKDSKKNSNKKESKKSDSQTQKSKIDEKDKKFIITLISVLVVMAILVLAVYNQSGPYNSEKRNNLTGCPAGSENADVCTSEYKPVCGYDSNKNKVKSFPNDCHACKNETVNYFTEGRCEK
ncbi:MAG: Kazal-type serine protease inhibitor [Candidatus Pacearchaeota archaeon]